MNTAILSRFIGRALAACMLVVSTTLPASMAPLTAAARTQPVLYQARYEPTEVKPIWIKIDLDADGTINRDELREEDPALLSRFDQADLDHDGTLSLRELELLLLSV